MRINSSTNLDYRAVAAIVYLVPVLGSGIFLALDWNRTITRVHCLQVLLLGVAMAACCHEHTGMDTHYRRVVYICGLAVLRGVCRTADSGLRCCNTRRYTASAGAVQYCKEYGLIIFCRMGECNGKDKNEECARRDRRR